MRLVVGSGGGSVVATVVAMVCRGSWLLLMLCVCACGKGGCGAGIGDVY